MDSKRPGIMGFHQEVQLVHVWTPCMQFMTVFSSGSEDNKFSRNKTFSVGIKHFQCYQREREKIAAE